MLVLIMSRACGNNNKTQQKTEPSFPSISYPFSHHLSVQVAKAFYYPLPFCLLLPFPSLSFSLHPLARSPFPVLGMSTGAVERAGVFQLKHTSSLSYYQHADCYLVPSASRQNYICPSNKCWYMHFLSCLARHTSASVWMYATIPRNSSNINYF